MKLVSFLVLSALLSISACSHHKSCCKKDGMSCEKEKKCAGDACPKDSKTCEGESCQKKAQ